MSSEALAYFLAADRTVVQLETLEFSHPAWSQVYRRVRNHRRDGGVRVTLETGESAWFDWYPMEIEEQGAGGDLDWSIRIDFGDLGEVLPRELDRSYAQDLMGTKPRVVYRTYRSDDLSRPLLGPIELEATTFSFKREGASFQATAPYVNNTNTGESYNLTRFPMLQGFAK